MSQVSEVGNNDFTFPKAERLTNKIIIKELFSKGSSFYIYPFRVKFLESPKITGVQVMFAVPVRNMKRAVQRNMVRRKLREVYRHHKHPLSVKQRTEQKGLAISFIYLEKQCLTYEELESKLILTLNRLAAKS